MCLFIIDIRWIAKPLSRGIWDVRINSLSSGRSPKRSLGPIRGLKYIQKELLIIGKVKR